MKAQPNVTTALHHRKECKHSHQYTRAQGETGAKSIYVPKNTPGFEGVPPEAIEVSITIIDR